MTMPKEQPFRDYPVTIPVQVKFDSRYPREIFYTKRPNGRDQDDGYIPIFLLESLVTSVHMCHSEWSANRSEVQG